MNRIPRTILATWLALLAAAFACRSVAACEQCRALSTKAYHVVGMGADDFYGAQDAPPSILLPENDDGLNVGTAQPAFAVMPGARWPVNGPNGSIILTYSYENMFDGALKQKNGQSVPAYIIRQSIETALQLWADVVPVSFVEVPDDGKPYGLSTQFGQIRFRHVWINGPDPPDPAPPIAKAQAYFPFGGDYGGDVEFDHGDPWEVVGSLHEPDLLGAATHEVGHSLGLNHTDVQGANMYWIFRRTLGLHDGWLHDDDIAGMRSIYGPGTGTVTPMFTIPEPAASILAIAAAVALLWRCRTPHAAHSQPGRPRPRFARTHRLDPSYPTTPPSASQSIE